MFDFYSNTFKKYVSLQAPQLLFLFFCFFLCSIVLGTVMQQLLVPQTTLHAPNSILSPDSLLYHELAVKLARLINEKGWSALMLFPIHLDFGQMSYKFLAITYVFFGENPLLVIPINSFLNALSGVLVYLISLDVINSRRVSLISATLFVIFPTSIVFYSQVSKDVYINIGILLITYTFLRILNRQGNSFPFLKYFCFYLAAIFLIAINRTYVLQFLMLQIFVILILQFLKLFPRNPLKIIFFSLAFMATYSCYQQIGKNVEFVDPLFAQYQNNDLSEKWSNSLYIPKFLDSKLNEIASLRSHFVKYNCEESKSPTCLDIDIRSKNAYDVLSYLPRAYFVALFAPFPNSWFTSSNLIKLVASFEMLTIYSVFFGLIFLVIYGFDYKVALLILLTIVPLTLYGFISPNLGTLYRLRFVYIILVLILGFLGWSKFIKNFMFSNKFRFKQK
jgi:hypothetical protein